ncbi:MAG: CHASE2 domain-containing protein [Myxococcaceae bacterium]|nr:CHASE2 domain-containing protein [Myxococcaceae bacterium]
MPSPPQSPPSDPPSAACLKAHEVALFAQGQLPEDRRQRITAHLAGCSRCQSLLGEDAKELQAAPPSPLPRSPELETLPLRVQLRPSSSPSGASRPDAPTGGGAPPQADAPAQDAANVPSGTRIGRYVIDRVLGQGGMGAVYLAHDPELDRRVAIKLLHPALSSSPENRARLLREAQAMARVSHPHVVAVHDVVTWQGQLFVAMEYVEGTTLKEWMRTRRALRQILEMFRKAGEGLAAAHAAGLIHRDFKPSNVLIGVDGAVQVSDFGLARSADTPPEAEPVTPEAPAERPAALLQQELTQTGLVMGTPGYMAPEQMLLRPADGRCDQFSFCVALYEALYGRRPFKGQDPTALVAVIYERKLQPPRTKMKVPPWVHEAVLRGLSPKPEERFPSMEALLTVLSRDPEEEESSRARFRQRVRRGVLMGALATALVAAVASTQAWRSFEERAQGLLLTSRPRPWNPDVFILAIDQAAIRQLGWPVPRRKQARLLEALERAGVRAVGVDTFFYLPARDGPEADAELGKVITRYGRVALAVPCTVDQGVDLERLAVQVEPSSIPAGPSPRFACGRILMPVEPLLNGSLVAQVEVARSASGNVHGAYLLAEVAGRTLPSLALSTYLLGNGMAPGTGLLQEQEGLRVGPLHIPLNHEGALLASFRMPDGDHFLSYGALYDSLGETDPPTFPPEVVERLRDKYVLIGQTAESIRDLGPFANGMTLPLVLLHAALLSDLLEQHPVSEVPRAWQLGLILLCGALLTAAALALRPTLTFASVLVMLFGILGGTLLLARNGLVLGPLGPMMASVLAFALVLSGRLSAEERERSLVRSAFDGYIDETDLGRLLAEARRPALLEGARKRVSVLYAQVRSPEEMLEQTPPEEWVQGLRRVFQAMTEEVVRRKGRVESLQGKGLLAVFGDPISLPDHAQRAVEAALAIQSRLEALRQAEANGLWPEIRVGVSTGEAVIGNVGLQGGRMEYAVMGAPLEQALQLSARAEAGGVTVSESTRQSCAGRIEFIPTADSGAEAQAFAARGPFAATG